jgi:OFA family oxalate/formate antiporter-like MFS transporter
VPLSSIVVTATGGWQTVFYIAAAMNAIAAILALVVLKPMRDHMRNMQ